MSNEGVFYDNDKYLEILAKEIDWHDKNAILCKRKHTIIKVASIICAIFISILSVVTLIYEFKFSPILTAVIAGCITFLETLANLKQYDKLYIIYRDTCEKLKKEKILFQTKTKPYDNDELCELVIKCNNILNDTKDGWLQTVQKHIK